MEDKKILLHSLYRHLIKNRSHTKITIVSKGAMAVFVLKYW